MNEPFDTLRATLQRVFPNARLQPATEAELAAIRQQFPGIPEHYLAFLRCIGWGAVGDNFMIYSGPVEPEEIFDAATAEKLADLVLVGDNFSGGVLGFDQNQNGRLTLCDGGLVEVFGQQTMAEFLAERLLDAEAT